MSVVAVAGGAALYFGLQRWINLHSVTRLPVSGKHVFDALMGTLQRGADALARALPYGSLPRMLEWLTVAVLVAGAWHWIASPSAAPPVRVPIAVPDDAALAEIAVVIWTLAITAAIAATVAYRQRFTALIFVGVTGLMVSLVVRAAVGPGPGADPAPGRGRHRGADDGRAPLPAADGAGGAVALAPSARRRRSPSPPDSASPASSTRCSRGH